MPSLPSGSVEPLARELVYQRILAFCRGDLPPAERAEVARRLEDPGHPEHARWRAHHDSVRRLDLERAAAHSDARQLRDFALDRATDLCRAVARTGGAVLDALVRGEGRAGDWPREEWARHLDRCVYCRRMRRVRHAEHARAQAGLPADEPLLRDWLLRESYLPALEAVTGKLLASPGADAPGSPGPAGEGFTATYRRNPEAFVQKMRRVTPVMLRRVQVPEGYAEEFLAYLGRPDVADRLGSAASIRAIMGELLAEFCLRAGLSPAEDPARYLTEEVMSNVLWQAAVEWRRQESPAAEQAGLETVRAALERGLSAAEPAPSGEIVRSALEDTFTDARQRQEIDRRLRKDYRDLAGVPPGRSARP